MRGVATQLLCLEAILEMVARGALHHMPSSHIENVDLHTFRPTVELLYTQLTITETPIVDIPIIDTPIHH